MPRTATLTSRTRRQADLMERLLGLFLDEGFAHFTLDEIAAALRCSKTTLYALAASKEQLAVEVVKHFFHGATDRVEAAVAGTDGDEQRVAAYLTEVETQLRRASRAFVADMAAFAPAREVYERNTRAAAGRIRQLIEAGIAHGSFRDVNVPFAAEMVAGTMTSIQRGDVFTRTGLSDADAYAELAAFLLAGLHRRTP